MLSKLQFNDLMEAQNLPDFGRYLSHYNEKITVPQAQNLIRHCEEVDPPKSVLKFAFLHTYTSDLLSPWFTLQSIAEGFSADLHHAPFGLNIMEATPESALARFTPDVTVMMFQQEDLHPDLKHPISGFNQEKQNSLSQEAIQNLVKVIGQFRAVLTGQIIVSILPKIQPPDLGLYDLQAPLSETSWWAHLKCDLAAALQEHITSTMLLDLDAMLTDIGRQNFFDPRLWYSARFPFSPIAAREFARRVVSLGVSAKRPKVKVIALDADNTLWGGIIGEDGVNGIALGPDYPGNLYVEFQRRVLGLQQRGFILVLCSKNNPKDLDEVLQQHPHQLLRDEHFAARRVNWEPKSENLTSMAAELNLGLESFIFIDDSDYECALVRSELPQVEVIQVPSKPINIPHILNKIARLEITSLTDEDRAKTALYGQERQRTKFKQDFSGGVADIDGYLRSLDMVLSVEINHTSNIARLAQLTQKTNQFNLTTRRYTEDVIADWITRDNWVVASFSLEDRFGHSGVVGLAIFEIKADREARLDSFLMSCRTIGRKAETAFLETTLQYLAEMNCTRVQGEYVPTEKNGLVQSFLPDHHFKLNEDGRYIRHLSEAPPCKQGDFPMQVKIL